MSNKKELPQISASEAKKLSVSALAVRPNDASRFGQGGLSASALQEWFDKLPNLVKDKFNEISRTLASAEATKYIGADALDADNLYDILALFGPRGTGTNDKNISDYIETLYAADGDSEEHSTTLSAIVKSISYRLAQAKAERDALEKLIQALDSYTDELYTVTDAAFHNADLSGYELVLGRRDGTEQRVDLSSLAYSQEAREELAGVKESISDLYDKIRELEGETIIPLLESLYLGGVE